jgi:hypothetical protein
VRYAFGLFGILVAVGVMIFIMSRELTYDKKVIDKGNTARAQAEQFAGVGARESVQMAPVESNGGRVDAIAIKALIPGGPIEKYYGVMVGDQVIQVGPQRVRDMNDSELAEAEILETYQRSGQIVVMRNGQKMTLPPASVSAAAIPPTAGVTGTPAGGTPGAGAGAPKTGEGSPESLLKTLNVPTH